MIKSIMPYVLEGISSDALLLTKRAIRSLPRKLRNKKPSLQIFIKPDDPYSYLLLHALPDLKARFDVDFEFHVFMNLDENMYPKLGMLEKYAQYDAYHLAELYGFTFPELDGRFSYSQIEFEALSRQLVAKEQDADFIGFALGVLSDFWFQCSDLLDAHTHDQIKQLDGLLQQNYELLTQLGHYLGAMIKFEGEWYFGIDRLDHLERRLIALGAAYADDEAPYYIKTYQPTVSPQSKEADQPIVLYWSARSPYSYIALNRVYHIAERYGIDVQIKPVLPMMMRGMNVPARKRMYIFLDTKREATKHGIAYGCVADPLGKAVERCYALLDYARQEGKFKEYLLSFSEHVNSKGVRAETDKGMRLIVESAGLDWRYARSIIGNQSWRDEMDINLKDMFALGCWGVPTVVYGEYCFWGQDRIGLIEQRVGLSIVS